MVTTGRRGGGAGQRMVTCLGDSKREVVRTSKAQ